MTIMLEDTLTGSDFFKKYIITSHFPIKFLIYGFSLFGTESSTCSGSANCTYNFLDTCLPGVLLL